MITLKSSCYTEKAYRDLYECLSVAMDCARSMEVEPYVYYDLNEVLFFLDKKINECRFQKKIHNERALNCSKNEINKIYGV